MLEKFYFFGYLTAKLYRTHVWCVLILNCLATWKLDFNRYRRESYNFSSWKRVYSFPYLAVTTNTCRCIAISHDSHYLVTSHVNIQGTYVHVGISFFPFQIWYRRCNNLRNSVRLVRVCLQEFTCYCLLVDLPYCWWMWHAKISCD